MQLSYSCAITKTYALQRRSTSKPLASLIEADNIYINERIEWDSPNNLILKARGNIVFKKEGKLIIKTNASVYLKAGLEDPSGAGTVTFEDRCPQLQLEGKGKAFIYYNPPIGQGDHKYHSPYPYFKHLNPLFSYTACMLVNNVADLQDINWFLSGNYALSRDIDASTTQQWNNGTGFIPLTIQQDDEEDVRPFCGNFDGNDFSINNLFINAKDTDSVGLFGIAVSGPAWYITIENIKFQNLTVQGSHYVGGVAGEAQYVHFVNLEFLNGCHITGKAVVGGVVGTASGVMLDGISFKDTSTNSVGAEEYSGLFCGAIREAVIRDTNNICAVNESKCIGYGEEVAWECGLVI